MHIIRSTLLPILQLLILLLLVSENKEEKITQLLKQHDKSIEIILSNKEHWIEDKKIYVNEVFLECRTI